MTDYSKLLNPEQYTAVTAGDGPLLVLAAAGTGKTRTLVYRVAYLIEKGLDPDRLLLLTFTNRAAREMLERAREVAGATTGYLLSGTFHHVCNRFLRRHAAHVGFRPDFTILDRDDSLTLIEQCVKETVVNRKEFPDKGVIGSLISGAANRARDLEDELEGRLDDMQADLGLFLRVAQLYRDAKHEMNAMDFDDLLVNGLKLLEEHEGVRMEYQERFEHVLVDEYQDTNLLQAKMVDILAARSRNVMAVGDDFQCIYSWRGANFKNIMLFPERWPDCRVIKLEQNYRSVPGILDVANACIKGNPKQFQKILRPTRAANKRPQVYNLRNDDEQAHVVMELVRRYQQAGYALREMAILYRAHFHSIKLQMSLMRANVPFVITSGVGVFEQAHVKDVLAFLRVCVGQADRLSFVRLLGMIPGVGEKTITKLWELLGGKFDSRDQLQRQRLMQGLRANSRREWQAIDTLLSDYHSGNLVLSGGALVHHFCEVFYRVYLNRHYENSDKREEDIQEVALQIERNPEGIQGFLQEVALFTNIDHEYDKNQGVDDDKIHLSTVHQAKGLEWPVVFIIWASEGMFPASRALGDDEDDSEERRLFYVAVTRAKDALVVCAPETRRTYDGGIFYCKPSRFIKELPRGLVQEAYGLW